MSDLAEIRQLIQANATAHVERLTLTKAVYRMEVQEITVDVVYSRSTKQVITFLIPGESHHEGYDSVSARERGRIEHGC